MDLAIELNANKIKIYKFYNLTCEDIRGLELSTEIISHMISKFEGYNYNPISFIDSLDSNIKEILFKRFNIAQIYHNFFVWCNYYYNYGKCFDDYCNYKVVLDTYYNENCEKQNVMIDKFYYQKLKHALPCEFKCLN